MLATTQGFNPDYSEDAPDVADVEASAGPLVLEFGAPWCGWCMGAAPHVRSAFADFPQIPHSKIHDGKGKRLGRAYRVKLWPTLIFLKDGMEVERLVRPGDAKPIREALARLQP